MNSFLLNDSQAFYPGLITDLLSQSYADSKGTTSEDKLSFQKFDQDVVKHPEWLGTYVFITTLDRKPIGFVSFDPRNKPQAEIGHNCVLPEYRGNGIGKKQIEYVLEQIHNQGFEEVIVSTCDNRDFIPAQKMYLACGFTETHRFYKDSQENNPNKKMIGYTFTFKQPGVDAFIIFENKILLILRDNIPDIQNPNVWNLPGGGIDKGESEESSLQRELEEEINLRSKNVHFIDKTMYKDGNVVSKFWVKIDDQEKSQLRLGEGQKMSFFTLNEILKLTIIPNLRNYIEFHKEKLQSIID